MPIKILHTDYEVKGVLKEALYAIMEKLTQKTEKFLKERLKEASISTGTMQLCVDHTIEKDKNGCRAMIYINDELMQTYEEPNVYNGGFGKFISLDGSNTYDGMSISWHLIDWVERGVNGNGHYIGNQPIKANHTFEKAFADIKEQMDKIIKETLKTFSQ